MAAPKDAEFHISFPLDLGVDNTAQESAVQPMGERAALVESVNTRLSVVRGAPTKAPDFDSITTLTDTPCGGIVPAGSVDSSIAFFHPKTGARRIAASTVGAHAGTISTTAVGSYWPAQISRAGVVPGGPGWKPPAICYDSVSGGTWSAVVRDDGDDGLITISLIGSNGEVLVTPTVAHTFATRPALRTYWVGLTFHANGAGGNPALLLFYKDDSTQSVKVRGITRSGFTLAIGAEQTIYTPHASGPTALAVASDSPTYAYLLCGDSATATSVAVVRVTAATLATSTTSFAVSAAADDRLDIANFIDSGGNNYVGAIVGSTLVPYVMGLNGATMGSSWGPTDIGIGDFSEIVYAGFGENAGGTYHVFTSTDAAGVALPSITGTWVEFRSTAGAALSNLGWKGEVWPVARPATLRVGTGEAYPILFAQRAYLPGGTFTSEFFLTDPSVEAYRIGEGVSGWTPVARVGVDTALSQSSLLTGSRSIWPGGATSFSPSGSTKVTFVYLENDISAYATLKGWVARHVELDFASQQPRYAITAEGSALIAGAMPMQWDGVEVAEVTPIHRPVVHVETTGGAGSAWTNATYQFSALFFFLDHNGIIHRSMPAAVRTHTGALDPIITVSLPVSMRDGVRGYRIECVIYATTAGGTTLYAQSYQPSSTSEFIITFDNLTEPAAVTTAVLNPSALTLQTLYTDGSATQELPAQCPPGLRDVEVVGLRAWAIEAERPNIVWPSKLRDLVQSPNVSFEWNADLRIEFPAHAGKLNAVRESNGLPLFFSDRGIYTVTGPGPNNLREGEFNPPEQLSDQPCTDGRSVVKTPVGVLFKSNNRYCLFAGQVRVFENLDAGTSSCVAAFLLRDQSEAVIVTSGSTHHVYNYALDRWTTWNSDCVPASTKACALVPTTGAVLTFSTADLYRSDGETASDTAQMKVRTGHLMLAGPQDECVVNDVLVRGLSGGTHGLTVTLATDYGAESVTTTFGPGDISACTVDGQYTLCASPKSLSTRSLKVTLQETGATGEGFRPLDVTVVGHRNPTTKRDAVKARGRSPLGS